MTACPLCGVDEAYIGLNVIDCTNSECSHFSLPYLEEKLAESEANFSFLIEGLGDRELLCEALSNIDWDFRQ